MTRYTAVTDDDRAAMLAAIGVASVEELFAEIPAAVRLGRELELPAGRGEAEVYAHLRDLAARNRSAEEELSFLGGGFYDHYVPAVIDMLTSRSEFLTPYTPYQPEVSQGGLQVMFEFQTAICELTGMDVANASVYEGPSALGAAAYMAKLTNGRPRFVISRGVHPHAREVLRTLSAGYGTTVVEVGLRDGVTDAAEWAAAMGDDVSAAFVAQPNFLGAVEDCAPLFAAARECGALAVCSADPIALGILEPPGSLGADVCVGEGQSLGNRLDFGGPSFGFFAAREEHLRRMPGRIAGETVDVEGRRGFVLTLQTREQHIRREKATSNICTAQALNALAGVVYLSWLGRRGLVELTELLVHRTAYARDALLAIDGVRAVHSQPVVREFAISLGLADVAAVRRVIARASAERVNPGYALGRELPEFADCLLVAITEQRSRADIDRLADVLARALSAERAGAATAGESAQP
jgi:glycine dehydrogenase subunit 1